MSIAQLNDLVKYMVKERNKRLTRGDYEGNNKACHFVFILKIINTRFRQKEATIIYRDYFPLEPEQTNQNQISIPVPI